VFRVLRLDAAMSPGAAVNTPTRASGELRVGSNLVSANGRFRSKGDMRWRLSDVGISLRCRTSMGAIDLLTDDCKHA
jgi:hypothetical protein